MKPALKTNPRRERQEFSASGLGSALCKEFPNLSIIHEIELRGAFEWRTLAEASMCLSRVGAEPVSVRARTYDDDAQVICCRIKYLDDLSLEAALRDLRKLPGIKSVSISHHLGRASTA